MCVIKQTGREMQKGRNRMRQSTNVYILFANVIVIINYNALECGFDKKITFSSQLTLFCTHYSIDNEQQTLTK